MRTLITILTTLSIAALARADTIQLRDTIRVTEGTPITLGLVAELTGDSAQSLSHKSFTPKTNRSEEHTSELQSLTNLVCRLLLEKKKQTNKNK